MEDFQLLKTKEGLYEIYEGPEGERLVVLEGLDVRDQHETNAIQAYIHTHYEGASLFYWVMLGSTLLYVGLTFVILPLYRTARHSLQRHF